MWIPMPSEPPMPRAPLVTVKPRSTEVRASPVLKDTTWAMPPPSMIVVAGPAELCTSMALPLKSMRST